MSVPASGKAAATSRVQLPCLRSAPGMAVDSAKQLYDLVSGLSRPQWRSVCKASGFPVTTTRLEFMAKFSVAGGATDDELAMWTACVREICESSPTDSPSDGEDSVAVLPASKRCKSEPVACEHEHGIAAALASGPPSPTFDDLVLSPWFGFALCPYLNTKDAARLRTANSHCLEMVKLHAWDDLGTRLMVDLVPLWRACFPFARSAALCTGQEINNSNLRLLVGLRRLDLDSAVVSNRREGLGLQLTDEGFAHFAGVEELNIANWGVVETVTDQAFAHLNGIRKLNMGGTQLQHVTDAAFTHIAGIQSLDIGVGNGRRGIISHVVTDTLLSHLHGIHELHMAKVVGCPVTDVGFVHLRGIHKLDLSGCGFMNISDAGLWQLSGIVELNLSECKALTRLTDAAFARLSGIVNLSIAGCSQFSDVALTHLASIKALDISRCTQFSDDSLSKLKGIEEFNMSACTQFSDAGLRHVLSVKKLTMAKCDQPAITGETLTLMDGLEYLDMQDCPTRSISREAFQDLHSITTLDVTDCNLATMVAAAQAYSDRRKLRIAVLTSIQRAAERFTAWAARPEQLAAIPAFLACFSECVATEAASPKESQLAALLVPIFCKAAYGMLDHNATMRARLLECGLVGALAQTLTRWKPVPAVALQLANSIRWLCQHRECLEACVSEGIPVLLAQVLVLHTTERGCTFAVCAALQAFFVAADAGARAQAFVQLASVETVVPTLVKWLVPASPTAADTSLAHDACNLLLRLCQARDVELMVMHEEVIAADGVGALFQLVASSFALGVRSDVPILTLVELVATRGPGCLLTGEGAGGYVDIVLKSMYPYATLSATVATCTVLCALVDAREPGATSPLAISSLESRLPVVRGSPSSGAVAVGVSPLLSRLGSTESLRALINMLRVHGKDSTVFKCINTLLLQLCMGHPQAREHLVSWQAGNYVCVALAGHTTDVSDASARTIAEAVMEALRTDAIEKCT